MIRVVSILLIFCCYATPGIATDSGAEVTDDEFFAALRIFRDNPGGNKAKTALKTIATFAEQSPDVVVEIDQKYFIKRNEVEKSALFVFSLI